MFLKLGEYMKKRFKICFLILMFIVGVNCANAYTAVTCGNITNIPKKIPQLTSMMVSIIQIATPIVLVIFGMLDLFKGITAQKEEEIKKGQQMFIKRLIVAAVIFFVIVIVKFLISIVADNTTETNNITGCMGCFLNGDCGKEYKNTYTPQVITKT